MGALRFTSCKADSLAIRQKERQIVDMRRDPGPRPPPLPIAAPSNSGPLAAAHDLLLSHAVTHVFNNAIYFAFDTLAVPSKDSDPRVKRLRGILRDSAKTQISSIEILESNIPAPQAIHLDRLTAIVGRHGTARGEPSTIERPRTPPRGRARMPCAAHCP